MGELVSVSVVGSTGSVGTQTLDVIRAEPGRFQVECIGAFRNVELLVAQAAEFADTFALRGYDSVQLAAANSLALESGAPVIFACFDTRLNKAAKVLAMDTPFA